MANLHVTGKLGAKDNHDVTETENEEEEVLQGEPANVRPFCFPYFTAHCDATDLESMSRANTYKTIYDDSSIWRLLHKPICKLKITAGIYTDNIIDEEHLHHCSEKRYHSYEHYCRNKMDEVFSNKDEMKKKQLIEKDRPMEAPHDAICLVCVKLLVGYTYLDSGMVRREYKKIAFLEMDDFEEWQRDHDALSVQVGEIIRRFPDTISMDDTAPSAGEDEKKMLSRWLHSYMTLRTTWYGNTDHYPNTDAGEDDSDLWYQFQGVTNIQAAFSKSFKRRLGLPDKVDFGDLIWNKDKTEVSTWKFSLEVQNIN